MAFLANNCLQQHKKNAIFNKMSNWLAEKFTIMWLRPVIQGGTVSLKIKKWIGLLLAGVVMATALTGCLGHQYKNAGKIDGVEIPSGLYLFYQLNAFEQIAYSSTDVQTQISAAQQSYQDTTPVVLASTIEDKPATQWLEEFVEGACRTYVVVQKLAAEKGITISEEDQATVDYMVSSYMNYYQQVYAANGIGEESVRLYWENQQLMLNLFKALYGEGAEKAPTKEEIETYYTEQNAHITAIEIPLTSSDGSAIVEDKDAVVAQAQAMADAISEGKTMDEAVAESMPAIIEGINTQLAAQAAATAEETDETATDESASAVDESAVDESAVDESEAATDEEAAPPTATSPTASTSYLSYTPDTAGTYTQEFLDGLKAASTGTTGVYEKSSSVMVYVKLDTFEDDEQYTSLRDQIVQAMKGDEYTAYLDEISDQYTVSWGWGAREFLSPEKIDSSILFSSSY